MCTGQDSNQGSLGPKSDALTTAPLRHLFFLPEKKETHLTASKKYIFDVQASLSTLSQSSDKLDKPKTDS